ncbi:MAG: efflux RND transporter periplasmic adaptor subunit, partial [Planctomycetota bacterium]
MNRKTITLLLGLLLGLACLGVVVAKNPRLREVLTPAVGAEADAGHAHPHPHDPGDQGHSHATDAAQEGGATGAAAAPAETQAHAHPHEDDGQAHQHPPAGDRQDQAAADDHEPGTIHLDEQRMAELGIEVAAVGSGAVQGNVSLSGEIKLNTDRVAHIVPQVSGIARSVLKTVGDRVKQGEVMAWLESAKLGETKVQYLAKLAEISCCSMELTRAQEVHDNTIQLLTALESSPSLEILRDTGGAPMGKNLSQLVSAYAEWVLAQKTYTREKGLYEKQITSQGEFLKAENALKKAEAIYNATRDSVAYDVQHDLLEAQRVQRVRQIELTSAERSLYVLGLTASDLHQLERMEQQGDPTGECDDPNCPTCRRQAQEEPASGSDETDHECDDPNCQDCAGHVHAGVAAGSDTTDHHCDDPNCQDCAGRVHAGVATGSATTDHHCDDPNCPECAGHVHAEVTAGSGASDHDCDDPNCQDCAEHVHVEVAAGSGAASCDCDDPNCQECAQEARDTVVVGSPEAGGYEERLAWYPVRAPFAGTIISKHLSTGEFVREESEVFVIADLDTVWVDFQVHQKDL